MYKGREVLVISNRLFSICSINTGSNGSPKVGLSRRSTQEPCEENEVMSENQGAHLTRPGAIATFCHVFDCQMMAETLAV
jgi:hypothetical protein